MKKFYYKKEEPKDRTPIVFRLERRHTIDAMEDKIQETKRKLSSRAASISSLDVLSEGPSRPRARTREVAKCLSEDVLSKGQSKVGRKVVTEAELSTSLLYKTMQESVNAKFKSPNKAQIPIIPQTGDLTPVVLKDPKMKPIIVKSSRPRNYSCCCQFVTIMAISLCTVGFLAAVAGIIYMEVFANKNLTSYEMPEKPVDFSEVVLDAREGHTELITHGFHSGKERPVEKPSSETNIKNTNNPVKRIEELTAVNSRTLGSKTPVTELNQYLNNENTKIKFQDSETVIYEVKPSDSVKFEGSLTTIDDFKSKTSVNFNDIEEDVDRKGFEVVAESKTDEKSVGHIKYSEAEIHKMLDESEEYRENSDSQVQNRTPEEKLQDNSIEIVSKEAEQGDNESPVKSDESDFGVNLLDLTKTEENEISGNTAHKIGPAELDEVLEDKIQNIEKSQENHDDEIGVGNQNSEMHHEVKILPSVHNEKQVLIDHNVDSMIMEVDDPEQDVEHKITQEIDSTVFSSRNGDMIPLETTTTTESPKSTTTENVHSITEASRPQGNKQKHFIKQPVFPKRIVDMRDMRVQLAEAMKHLQVLDTNNRIATSRKKAAKPKVDNSKKRKQSSASRKEEEALEKKKYLQKVRLMLYEQFQ